MLENLKSFYFEMIKHHELAVILSFSTIFLIVLFISWVMRLILNKYLVKMVKIYLNKSQSNLAQILAQHHVFKRLSHIAPGIFIFLAIGFATYPDHHWTISLVMVIQLIAQVYIIIAIIWFLIAFVDAMFTYFQTLPYFKNHSLKSYAQIIKIILFFIAFVLVVSLLLNKSPIAFLTGLGALSAVLMLVFKARLYSQCLF
ncbi:hypothetical protein QIW57_01615 [Francisellaceae bacterium CB52]